MPAVLSPPEEEKEVKTAIGAAWGRIMEHERDFDGRAFLDLLAEVMSHHATGVVSMQIHIRDGMPWAVSLQFNDAAKKAA